MINKQKEHHRKQQWEIQGSLSSEEFEYDPDYERHIGKRTGQYFGRIKFDKHFDGFPRFSDYPSYRKDKSPSLARELAQDQYYVSIGPDTDEFVFIDPNPQPAQPEPFATKESPIIMPVDSNPNASSRGPQGGLFSYGQNPISSIKRRTSNSGPSDIKTYRDLLSDLEDDEFKEFIFNEDQIREISTSAKKERQNEQRERIKEEQESRRRQQEEEMKKKQMKKKKEARVSFKEEPIQHFIFVSPQKKTSSPQKLKKQEKPVNKQPIQPQKQQKKVKIQPPAPKIEQPEQQFHYYEPEYEPDRSSNRENSKPNTQKNRTDRGRFKKEQQDEDQGSQSKKDERKQEDKAGKVNNRKGGKKKKEKRITDTPSQDNQQEKQATTSRSGQNKNNTKQKETHKEKQKQKSKQKQQSKQKPKAKIQRSKKVQQKITKNEKLQNHGTKMRIKSQQKQLIQQLTSSPEQKSGSSRYPRRTRIKPVQFWQNQRVHYRGGKVVGIERTQTFDIKELLNTRQMYESIINVNFATHDMEMQVILPGKKNLQSQGIKDIYQSLEIKVSDKGPGGPHEIYFEDGVRSEKLQEGDSIKVQPFAYFELTNHNKTPVFLQMKLKAKIA